MISLFLDFTDENSQSRICKECEEKNFLISQMKTHIRDNHAEYRKIETSGLNPNRFEPKFCLENVKKKRSEPVKKTFEVI